MFCADQHVVGMVYHDNGIGIREESLKKIFEPFYTTYRSKGSIGLGLNIGYNIVTYMLKGSINVESVINEGTEFRIKWSI